MKTKRKIRNFILKTLLPYKEDPNLIAMEDGHCSYLTSDGRKCAVGKWLKKGDWQYSGDDVKTLFSKYGKKILLKKGKDMGFTNKQWDMIQQYHDFLKDCTDESNKAVKKLEKEFDIALPELYLDEELE